MLDQEALRVNPAQAMSEALEAGVRFFQYRNKRGTRREIYEISLQLIPLAREAGALFIVNDHADIALAVEADGVHLGQDDLPIEHARNLLGSGKLIGISTHSPDQAKAAKAGGADYIGFGPVFRTSTKDAGPVQGIETISVIKRMVSLPVIAIGGITLANVGEAVRAGADGVAVISSVLSAPDRKIAAVEMIREIQRNRKQESKVRGMDDE
ncbi:MAG TPA: thiamine phosphate synthase [Nitrospirota bacterium]